MDFKKGFTLIEVMVAIAIMATIMVLLWSSSTQSLNTKDRVEKRDMVYQQGRVALRKLNDDLVVAFLAKWREGEAGGAPRSPPVKTFFIGKDLGDHDSLKFTSLSHLRLFQDAKESDQCKVLYEVVADPLEPRLYNLVRHEDVWLDDTTELRGAPLVLAEGIREFNVEYYDERSGDWTKEWNTEGAGWRDRLPRAVRINMAFPDPDEDGEAIRMSTAILLPLSKNPIEL